MNKKIIAVTSTLVVIILLGMMTAICTGAKSISLDVVFDSIFRYEDVLEMQLVRDVRIPRAICATFVGGLLAVTGAMMQGVTRNPIAEPSLMGITQGATLAIAIVGAMPTIYGLLGNMVAAFIGAFLSGMLVLLFSLANPKQMNLSRLLLAGTALSTFFIGIATIIGLLTNKSQSIAYWVAGGFRSATWDSVKLVLVVGIITLFITGMLGKKINIVSLGDDVCIGLGESPTKIRTSVLFLVIPMCAVSVAVAGNIAFIGLIIPHIVRKIVGVDYRKILPLSFLGGAALVIWSDVLARLVNQPYETPIGLFTSLIGVPLFITMIRREH